MRKDSNMEVFTIEDHCKGEGFQEMTPKSYSRPSMNNNHRFFGSSPGGFWGGAIPTSEISLPSNFTLDLETDIPYQEQECLIKSSASKQERERPGTPWRTVGAINSQTQAASDISHGENRFGNMKETCPELMQGIKRTVGGISPARRERSAPSSPPSSTRFRLQKRRRIN
ncbi:uncharacterized protein PRCAT00005120001 [Priceomyces carsonii]|uniref:uncharacterized protein n=1 Tax=Priceomyces carsonii TaxID=28549 RepID=UPI002EDB11EE|nr:unnamed protein product [Priceomyces carsonii]